MKKILLFLLAVLPFVQSQAQENLHIVVVKQKIIKFGKPNELSKEYKIYKMTDEAWEAFKKDGLQKDLAAYGDNIAEAKNNTVTKLTASVLTPPPPKDVPFESHYYMDHVVKSGECYVVYKNKEYEKKGVEIVCKVSKKEDFDKMKEQAQAKNKYFEAMLEEKCID